MTPSSTNQRCAEWIWTSPPRKFTTSSAVLIPPQVPGPTLMGRQRSFSTAGFGMGILNSSVENETDFFAAGAGSMDVVRLIEEVKEASGVTLANEDVFMATQLGEF